MRLSRVLTLVIALLLTTAAPAAAHTSLVSTDPEDGATVETAPAQVVLTFSEKLREPSEASLVVDGDPVEIKVRVDGPRLVVAPGEPRAGDHEVNYRVVSADGHPVSGTTSFTVTAAAGGAPAAEPTSPSAEPTDTTQTSEPSVNETEDDTGGTPVWLWVVLALVVAVALGAVAVVRQRAGSRHVRP